MSRRKYFVKYFAYLPFIFLMLSCGEKGKVPSVPTEAPIVAPGEAPVTVPAEGEEAKPPEQVKGEIFYVRITEKNSDTLEFSYRPSVIRYKTPFYTMDNELRVSRKVYENVKQGITDENYRLITEPASFDLSKATLFIEYVVSFAGEGRNTDYTEYYIFRDVPAAIKLESFDKSITEIKAELLESLSTKLEAVRYLPNEIRLTRTNDTLMANTQELLLKQKIEIFTSASQTISIKKKLLEPIPISAATVDISKQTKLNDMGTGVFSTNISVENEGKFDEFTIY